MWQIGVQNVRVYLAFQAAKKDAERLAPFTTNAETKFVPATLDYTGATDKSSRFFNVQADGILHGHIKETMPADDYDVLEIFVWNTFRSNVLDWQWHLLD